MTIPMQPTIYLDMDGCVVSPDEFDDDSFRNAVRDNKIFEKLEMMPSADKLLKAMMDDLRVLHYKE